MHPILFSDGIFIIALILSARLPVLVLEIISILSGLFWGCSFLLWLLLAPWLRKNTSHKFPFCKLDQSHDTRLLLVTSDDVRSGDLRAVSTTNKGLRWCQVFSWSFTQKEFINSCFPGTGERKQQEFLWLQFSDRTVLCSTLIFTVLGSTYQVFSGCYWGLSYVLCTSTHLGLYSLPCQCWISF